MTEETPEGGEAPADTGGQPPADDGQFPHVEPVPVEVTDSVIRSIKDDWGEDTAERFQAKVGDQALIVHRRVQAFGQDHPVFEKIYQKHTTDDDRALSPEGMQEMAVEFVNLAGVKDERDLKRLESDWAELGHIIDENLDARGHLTPLGFILASNFTAKKLGYGFTYRGKQ